MYCKIFKTIFDGSLYGNFDATVTFMALIILAERGGIVDMTPRAIAAKCGYPIDIIERGLAELELPDPQSRTQDDEGRRIVRIDEHRTWGWRITNFETYHRMRTTEDRQEYFAARYAARRASSPDSTTGSQIPPQRTDSTHSDSDSDSDVDKDVDKKKNLDRRAARAELAPEFVHLQSIYPKRAGGNRTSDASKAINARLTEGYTWLQIHEGAGRYATFMRAEGKEGTSYVMQLGTFVGPNKGFLERWDLSLNKAEVKRDANISASLDWLQQQEAKHAESGST